MDPSKTCCTRFFVLFRFVIFITLLKLVMTCSGIGDRAEKRLRMRAVDSSWCVLDRLINERLPP